MGHHSPPLAELEAQARQLDTTPTEFGQWLDQAYRFALDYLRGLPDEPAYRRHAAAPQLEASLPEKPRPLQEVLKELERVVLRQGVVPTSGRFMGYVPGGGLPSAAVGDFLAAITNRYAGVDLACPGAAQVENLTVRWLRNHVASVLRGQCRLPGRRAGRTIAVASRLLTRAHTTFSGAPSLVEPQAPRAPTIRRGPGGEAGPGR